MSGPFPNTPKLDALLARLAGTLRRNVWLYGLGTAVAAAAAWVLFMYVADRVLQLPAAIRVFHLVVLVVGVGVVLFRTLVRHRRSIPHRDRLAMMAESALPPEIPREDKFVSAIQLVRTVSPDAPSAPLVRRLVASAEELTVRVDLSRVTDARKPRQRFALGAFATFFTAGALAVQPAMASIFAARLFGANVPWPRATTLFVEVPAGQSGVSLDTSDPSVIRVRAARGTDIPVFVRAEGVVPSVITLTFESSGAALDVTPSGPGSFRTVLASVQADATVRVTGGDDDRGEPRIEVEVLQPPDIAQLAFEITPPDYAGIEPSVASDVTSVRVLAGSRVAVHVVPDPADVTGLARTFPDDQVIELTQGTFPLTPTQATPGGGEKPTAAPESLSFARVVAESLRFRFELKDESGLSNPDPALFGIEVYADRAPEVVVLSPVRTEHAVVVGSALPLRAIARDDFGVDAVELEIIDGISEDVTRTTSLETTALIDAGDPARARESRLATRLVEIDALVEGGPPAEGAVMGVRIAARDGRRPEPNRTNSSPITLRVVSQDEFLRRQRDALRLSAEGVGRIRSRVDTAEVDLANLLATASGDDAEVPDAGQINALLNDARRIQGDVQSLTRDLADLAEGLVFSRIDARSGALEARLIELLSSPEVRGFSRTVWETIAVDRAAGRLGAPTTSGDLVDLVSLGLDVSGPRADAWIETLVRAREAQSSLDAVRNALGDSNQTLSELREALDRLAGELGEWDSMQAIQARARDILNSSKNLQQRLKKQAEGK